MSLAHVTVTSSEFELVHDHLTSHKPPYRNMHLREARQRRGKRVLRYLHAMHATPGAANEIEGVISGPGVFWHYKLIKTKYRTQLNILSERGSPEDLARLGKRFLHEILKRVRQEQAGPTGYPSFTAGQFYLRRNQSGTLATHPTCVRAVKLGVLDRDFVSRLASWKLGLLQP